MAGSSLHYCEDYNNRNAIRVSVDDCRENLSWAVLDLETGEIIEECQRGAFLFPGLTDAQLAEAKEAIKGFHRAPYENAYIRFNDLPKSGFSKNYATGENELGVSCYEARWDIVTGVYKRDGAGLDGAAIRYILSGSPVYLITGEEISRGSDGEPTLRNARVLAELTYDRDSDGYRL